jgi:hypothetical protein
MAPEKIETYTPCILRTRPVYRRNGTVAGYKAQCIARSTFTPLYTSTKRSTDAAARQLAEKWLRRNAWAVLLYTITVASKARA